ncbi:hypothetical protein VNO78_35907 [Psophocarpus tetragonolobus]|uniref:Uncharacterized protein n=1 Tax=Psophocarpus tetragonolobus TaxID=3891 RepID=A0AAN9RKU0_PSOTE
MYVDSGGEKTRGGYIREQVEGHHTEVRKVWQPKPKTHQEVPLAEIVRGNIEAGERCDPPIISEHTTNFAKPNHDSNFAKSNHGFMGNVNCGINEARDLEFLGHAETCIQHLDIRVAALNLEELMGTHDDASVGQQCVGRRLERKKFIMNSWSGILDCDSVCSMGTSLVDHDVECVEVGPLVRNVAVKQVYIPMAFHENLNKVARVWNQENATVYCQGNVSVDCKLAHHENCGESGVADVNRWKKWDQCGMSDPLMPLKSTISLTDADWESVLNEGNLVYIRIEPVTE